LDPRVVHYWRIHSLIGAGILLLLALVIGLVLIWNVHAAIPWVAAAWVLLLALRIVLLLWYPPRAYAAWAYRLDNKVLETRQGIWIRTVTLLPLPRLQHVDLHRGPLERAFGLASLTLFTAGTQHASISLPGLDADEASQLRDRLVAAGGDDAV
jgi:membrane protein YdbS with pleckstrin-like domain